MAAIAVTRGRELIRPGHRVYRGVGTWNATDTTGALGGLPKGNIIGARFTSIGATPTPVAYGVESAQTNGVISCTGSLNIIRSAGTESGAQFFFELEYDSL